MSLPHSADAAPIPATGVWPVRRRVLVTTISVLAGFLLTVLWSAPFVDRVIGDNVANTMLGYDAKHTPIDGVLTGVVFAFVTGLAGSFTACNVAVFGVVAPVVGDGSEGKRRLRDTLRPLGWITVGLVFVSAMYGALVALAGTMMPQFATTASGGGLSPSRIQSMIVFGLIGVVMIYLGLAALRLVPDPLVPLRRSFPNGPLVLMGALIGGLLIGRPFALFRVMFRDAAESHDMLYGMAAFVLQSLGNVVVMAVVTVLLVHGTRGRLQRWLTARPGRLAEVTGAAFLVVGSFTLLYWDLRVLGRAGLIWYPTIGW